MYHESIRSPSSFVVVLVLDLHLATDEDETELKVASATDVRNAMVEAKKDGKHSVLMRLKSEDATKFVAVPIARA